MVQANPSTGLIKHDKKHRLKQRFEVKHKLGQGTYGKVQLAINKETGQEVAIKTIKKSKIQSEQDLVRIRREIQIMSSIQHPHIIHIYEVFENKEKIVLVMQYASGGELYEYVSDRKVLSDNEARRLFRQIATAVYYCHKNKVCHRDLKLENILLDHNGNAKIADFGLSNVFDEKHFLNTFCGSPLYASPEIVKGIPYYGAEVDCWSLGVLLYTLVYGAMPFDGSNFKRLVKQISESSYYEPKQKSEASGLIRRLLAVDPTKRATIIDICTDWWVNKGYEHSLLQVAEDLANLTPVRLDVLLALAPISPPAESESQQNPLSSREADKDSDKLIKSRPTRSDEASCSPSMAAGAAADTSELSTDIPTYAEEDEEELADVSEIVDDGEEFLPSAVAAALQDEYQEIVANKSEDKGQAQASSSVPDDGPNESSKSTKRIAGSSFDSNSMSRVSSQAMKRKKPKKGVDDVAITESEDRAVSSSGYMSDGTSIATFPTSQMVTDDLTQEMDRTLIEEDDASVIRVEGVQREEGEDDETMLSKTTMLYDSLPDENVSISSQISSLPATRDNSKAETRSSGTATAKTQSSASIETLTAKDSQASPSEVETSSSTLVDSQQFSRHGSTSSVKSKSKSVSPKRPVPSKTSTSSFASTASSSSTIITGKQPSSSTANTAIGTTASKSVSDKRIKPGEKGNRKSAKESPPKTIKDKSDESVKKPVPTTLSSTIPTTSTSTTTVTSTTASRKDSISTPGSPSASASEAGDSTPTTPDADKTKPWLERRSSVNRKVGKISYPKFLENTTAPEKKPVPTYGKISTAKKMFENRRSSVDKDKERVIPMVKVSDAKRAFERRASMPVSQAPLWKNAGERKASLIQQSSLDETVSVEHSRSLSKDKSASLENNKPSTSSTRPRKSPSSPVKSRSPNKSPVKTVIKQSTDQANKLNESKSSETTKEVTVKPKVKSTSQIVINSKPNSDNKGTNSQASKESKSSEVKPEIKGEGEKLNEIKDVKPVVDETESVKRSNVNEVSSREGNEEEKKIVAKDIIKKQIAKAKLQELRQSSVESHESTLSGSSDQQQQSTQVMVKLSPAGVTSTSEESSSATAKPKSYVKAPQPFIKEEIKPTPIRSVAEIKLSSKPKLGLDIEAAHRGQQQHLKEIEEVLPTSIVEPPSTAGTVQNQESNPGTPSTATTLSKAAPITRSYKKVTFTKDGACITETGKIISEEGADGSFSRIEKKSKVTHYPMGSGSGTSTATRSESSEEKRNVKSFTGESLDESQSDSLSPPVVQSIPGLRRSESASSSGSTDIFDDIFDTWSGDPVFSNISGRMRSMLSSSRSPFSSMWGTGRTKRSKKKSRAESAERKPTTETGLGSGVSWRRVPGHGTDQEFSDTDTDTEPSMGFGGGGLWKFLGSTPTSTNLIDRHRSLLSRHIGSDDFFSDAEPFGSSFRRSLSRDRGSTSFGQSQNSSKNVTPTVRMVINPLRNPRASGTSIMTSTPPKQDSLDSNESGGSNTQQQNVTSSFSSKPVTGRPYSRTVSRESQRKREGGIDSNIGGSASSSFDLDDGPLSHRRVEQWLDMNRDDEEIGSNHPISMYTTIRPRPINRYGRSVSSRFGFDLGSIDSPRESFDGPASGSNLSFNTTQEIQIGAPETSRTVTGKPRSEVIIPLGRSTSPTVTATRSSSKPLITMKLSLGGGSEPREVRTFISSAGTGGGVGVGGLGSSSTITTTTGIVETPGSAESMGSDWSGSILLPESSSLLDQLRTHGYRNLVTQRLSGLSGASAESRYDNRDNSCVSTSTTTTTTSTTTTPTTNTKSLPPQQMKRGKSLTGDSSSVRNLENLIVNNDGYIAWSNPVNGQPNIINYINNNSMPIKSMESTTNRNDINVTSSNRIVRVTNQPVDHRSDGVNSENNDNDMVQQKLQVNCKIKLADDDGNGVNDDSDYTRQMKGEDKSANGMINSAAIRTNCNTFRDLMKINNNRQRDSSNNTINSKADKELLVNDQDHKQTTNCSPSESTTILKSLPPKPKPFVPVKGTHHFKSDLTNSNEKVEEEDKYYYNHNHHHLRQNLVPNNDQAPFRLHQQSVASKKDEPEPTPSPSVNNRQKTDQQPQHEHCKQQFNDIKTCFNNKRHLNDDNNTTTTNTCINRKNDDDNNDNSTSHRSLINSSSNIYDLNHKETLQERILRKSYYSRFNHPLERRPSSVRRRTSMIENSDRFLDFSLFDNFSRQYSSPSPNLHHHQPNAHLHTVNHQKSPIFDNHLHSPQQSNSHHLKPPLFLTNDQFIERVQVRAQQLIEEARERHARITSKLMPSLRPNGLDLINNNNENDLFHPPHHHHIRNHSSPQSSHFPSPSSSHAYRSREPSPMSSLRRTSSFSSGSDEFYLIKSSRRPSSSSTTSTISTATTSPKTNRSTNVDSTSRSTSNRSSSNYQTARTGSTRLTNGNSQDLDDEDYDPIRNIDDNDDGNNNNSNVGDLEDDLTSRAQVVSEALKILKERALQEN